MFFNPPWDWPAWRWKAGWKMMNLKQIFWPVVFSTLTANHATVGVTFASWSNTREGYQCSNWPWEGRLWGPNVNICQVFFNQIVSGLLMFPGCWTWESSPGLGRLPLLSLLAGLQADLVQGGHLLTSQAQEQLFALETERMQMKHLL